MDEVYGLKQTLRTKFTKKIFHQQSLWLQQTYTEELNCVNTNLSALHFSYLQSTAINGKPPEMVVHVTPALAYTHQEVCVY